MEGCNSCPELVKGKAVHDFTYNQHTIGGVARIPSRTMSMVTVIVWPSNQCDQPAVNKSLNSPRIGTEETSMARRE